VEDYQKEKLVVYMKKLARKAAEKLEDNQRKTAEELKDNQRKAAEKLKDNQRKTENDVTNTMTICECHISYPTEYENCPSCGKLNLEQ
jgi:hypothetical protein